MFVGNIMQTSSLYFEADLEWSVPSLINKSNPFSRLLINCSEGLNRYWLSPQSWVRTSLDAHLSGLEIDDFRNMIQRASTYKALWELATRIFTHQTGTLQCCLFNGCRYNAGETRDEVTSISTALIRTKHLRLRNNVRRTANLFSRENSKQFHAQVWAKPANKLCETPIRRISTVIFHNQNHISVEEGGSGDDALGEEILRRASRRSARYLPSPGLARALFGLSRAERNAALWEIAYTANKEIARRDKEPECVTLMSAPPCRTPGVRNKPLTASLRPYTVLSRKQIISNDWCYKLLKRWNYFL